MLEFIIESVKVNICCRHLSAISNLATWIFWKSLCNLGNSTAAKKSQKRNWG